MRDFPMVFQPESVARTLRRAWSRETARQWTRENPAMGQCNVTALLINELFGGEILKTPLAGGDHFYNNIKGQRYDFTGNQFDTPIDYLDIPATRADAQRGATDAELAALRAAFGEHYAPSDDARERN